MSRLLDSSRVPGDCDSKTEDRSLHVSLQLQVLYHCHKMWLHLVVGLMGLT